MKASNILTKKIVILLVSTLTIMAAAIIAPSLPKMQKAFENRDEFSFLISAIITITSFSIGLTAPFAGFLVDKMGRKPLLLASLFLYGLAGSTGLFFSSLKLIFLGRVFLGISIGGTMTAAVTLVADYLSGKERERFLGIQSSFIALGGVVFLISGGYLAAWQWRAPFAMYLFSWLLLPFVYFIITEPEKIKRKMETSALENAPIPIVKYSLILVTVMCTMMLYFLLPTKLPFHLDKILSLDPSETGFFLASSTFCAGITSFFYSKIHRVFTKPAIYMLMLLVMGIGLQLISSAHVPLIAYLGSAVTGLGFGLLIPNSSVWVTEMAPDIYRGRLVGGLTACFFFGQFFSTIIGEPISRMNGIIGPLGVFGIASYIAFSLSLIFAFFVLLTRRIFTK